MHIDTCNTHQYIELENDRCPACESEKSEHRRLDQAYQDGFKNAPTDPEEQKGWMPPCPRCGGQMEYFDLWLVTAVSCTVCKWGMSEGSGCLI